MVVWSHARRARIRPGADRIASPTGFTKAVAIALAAGSANHCTNARKMAASSIGWSIYVLARTLVPALNDPSLERLEGFSLDRLPAIRSLIARDRSSFVNGSWSETHVHLELSSDPRLNVFYDHGGSLVVQSRRGVVEFAGSLRIPNGQRGYSRDPRGDFQCHTSLSVKQESSASTPS